MYTHPGKKLLFMGDEFGQWNEWHHEAELDWELLEQPQHEGLRRWVRDLNALYRSEPALFRDDFSERGFEWIDCNDSDESVLAYLRKADGQLLLVAVNFTPVPRRGYRVGVPRAGHWREALNSDAAIYGGSDSGNLGGVESKPIPAHGHYDSLTLTLPPLGVIVLQPDEPSVDGS
jgi:1,4-alpha-glucan branching enzyme